MGSALHWQTRTRWRKLKRRCCDRWCGWVPRYGRNLRAFPDEAKKIIGDELQLIQFGGMPKDAKPFKGVGSGVFEIALRHDAEAYRTVLAVQFGRNIYVLHAFQKKSKKGIATPKPDVDLIKQRYKEARELAEYEQDKR
jgi:phage-related protein